MTVDGTDDAVDDEGHRSGEADDSSVPVAVVSDDETMSVSVARSEHTMTQSVAEEDSVMDISSVDFSAATDLQMAAAARGLKPIPVSQPQHDARVTQQHHQAPTEAGGKDATALKSGSGGISASASDLGASDSAGKGRSSSGDLKEGQLSEKVEQVVDKQNPATQQRPQQDISRLIRRAYESLEPVKLKALADDDPSVYYWKVLHSVNQQKLGYASIVKEDVAFYDLRGQEVLRVAKAALPGLSIPQSRQARVQKILQQMRKSSKRDVLAELMVAYEVDGRVLLQRARDAEFEFRVTFGGEQIGWASPVAMDTEFYDMNGVLLLRAPTKLLSPASVDNTAPRRINTSELNIIFNNAVQLVRCEGGRYEFKVVVEGGGQQVGWGEREAFDFAVMNLKGEVVGKVPLAQIPQSLFVNYNEKQSKRRGSSSASTKGAILGRFMGDKDSDGKSGDSKPLQRSNSGKVGRASTNAKNSPSRLQAASPTNTVDRSPETKRKSSSTTLRAKLRASGTILNKFGITTGGAGAATTAAAPPAHDASASASASSSPSPKQHDSGDFSPTGLSPALQDTNYDLSSAHRPMGLVGLCDPATSTVVSGKNTPKKKE